MSDSGTENTKPNSAETMADFAAQFAEFMKFMNKSGNKSESSPKHSTGSSGGGFSSPTGSGGNGFSPSPQYPNGGGTDNPTGGGGGGAISANVAKASIASTKNWTEGKMGSGTWITMEGEGSSGEHRSPIKAAALDGTAELEREATEGVESERGGG
ncbi:hypothetical protein SASPL_141657 [Salvia splendens]|uniref:Uncharacterized protein n=1 Tax=Salvia splendens TaxID=180675 RepID=A0A8X8WJW6_SALSN|nr:hypothetical protein SASPL_141657 [Salvia splendens]